MEKIERYLDQICGRIAGPRAMRAHIRQELREHLLDSIAEHKAAGMPEEEALVRALADFGGPDQVRTELEATHGHRMMAVILEKALQWKENTMKTRWLWTSLAYIAFAIVLLLEVVYLVGAVIFFVPRFLELVHSGSIADAVGGDVAWSVNVVHTASTVVDNWFWLALITGILWFLFEWRVRGENKTLMRLFAMGGIATGLMIAVILVSVALSLPFLVTIGNTSAASIGSMRLVDDHIAAMDRSLAGLDVAVASKDWNAIQQQVDATFNARLPDATLGVLLWKDPRVKDLSDTLRATRKATIELHEAAQSKDAARLAVALETLHTAYGPIQHAAAPTTQSR